MIKEKKIDRGVLITIEGIDGSGKSTQARILSKNLKDRGYKVILLHEPTESIYGKEIKESAITGRYNVFKELKFFIEDRKEDVKRNIKPALNKKKIVIMDRYYFSTIAYQGARGVDPDKIKKLNEKIAPKPDLTIILDVSPETGLSRIEKKRDVKPNHFEKREYLTKVRELFQNFKDTSIIIIDGSQSINEISKKILKIALDILEPALE